MKSWTQALAGAAVAAALLAGTAAVPAHAVQDGRVDVTVSKSDWAKTVLDDVSIKRATEKVADLCGGPASKYAKAARKADRSGTLVIVCSTRDGRSVSLRD